ncbi:MAG: heme lyase CcmF/NrfE family subunit [Deltaproteobacteria bacterium]|nr:MAG: heme lyase CcmF/NrfE family subunit [Deltaproteobacteria bacterium]
MPFWIGSTLANTGQTLMITSMATVALAFWMALTGLYRKDKRYIDGAYKASIAFTVVTLLAYSNLIYAFFTHDFAISYVARYSERAMPSFYLFCAGWGGQDGSLLFWTLLMGLLSAIAARQVKNKYEDLFPAFLVVVSGVELFFVIITFFAADPFATLAVVPLDGKGLNPLLQTPVMAIHPPNLYMGLITFYIPYALGMAALISGKLDNRWIRATRPWTMLAWSFLTVGNLLGGYWAYNELGWGGFWAWDPVENASFLPWLLATAFLHSAMVQERRGMLKIWNMVLLILTFFLTIFGTFLTRSGLISSIHAFARSDIGTYFTVFLALILLVSFGFLWLRRGELRSDNRLNTVWSRESSFLLNNMLFSLATFVVLLGTTYPLLIEWISGTKATVGPPFFNRVMAPIALGFLTLMGVTQLMSWGKTNMDLLKRLVTLPLIGGVLAGVGFAFYYGHVGPGEPSLTTRILASSMAGLCAFVVGTIIMDLVEGVRRRRETRGENGFLLPMFRHIQQFQRMYGGYVVHIGVVFLFMGFAGYGFNLEKGVAMKKGEWSDIGSYLVKFNGLHAFQDRQKKMVEGHLVVHKATLSKTFTLKEGVPYQLPHNQGTLTLRKATVPTGSSAEQSAALVIQRPGKKAQEVSIRQSISLQHQLLRVRNVKWNGSKQLFADLQHLAPGTKIAEMVPSRHKFNKHRELTTEVALNTRLVDDFYAILVTWENDGTSSLLAHFKFYLNPLVAWLWLGGFIMIIGAIISVAPKARS